MTHSSLSHREVFLDGLFRVVSHKVIDKYKFLTSRLSPSCVLKRTLAISHSADAVNLLAGLAEPQALLHSVDSTLSVLVNVDKSHFWGGAISITLLFYKRQQVFGLETVLM